MSWHNPHWHGSTVTITKDVDEILDLISSEKIASEHSKRVAEEITDKDSFLLEEKWRDNDQIDIEIDPDDYDLMYQDNENLDDFDDYEIIDYIEDRGYIVIKKGTIAVDMDALTNHLNNLPSWKFKEIMCDILDLSHLASKEDIINELKNKL